MWKALIRKCVLLPKTLNKNKIMNELKFSESEIPYEELANFGLSQEMIDDFPESIMNKFLSGQRTPLLPIERADFDGVVHKDFALTANRGWASSSVLASHRKEQS